jgi:hypothetical protein
LVHISKFDVHEPQETLGSALLQIFHDRTLTAAAYLAMSNNRTATFAFHGPSTFAIKTAMEKAPANNIRPESDSKALGSPSNSKLKHRPRKEEETLPQDSKLGIKSTPLERTETGTATLGPTAFEEMEKSCGEGDGSRRSGRSGRGGRQPGRAEPGRAEVEVESGSKTKSYHKRSGTKFRQKQLAIESNSKPLPLTKAALASMPTHQSMSSVKARTKKQKERAKKPDDITVSVDVNRKALVRKGVYDNGTKPWKDRFGDADMDLFEVITRNKFYQNMKKHFWLFF